MATQQQPTSALAVAAPTAAAVAETSATAVAAREKAAVEARFLMAMHRPRNPDDARTRILQRCKSPRFAEVAEYAKPVGGKKVRGASIRMMEELARQWGNIDVQSPVVFDDAERRIIRVTATDLESNYSASTDVMLEKTVERKNPREGDEVLGRRMNSQNEIVFRIRADEDAFLVKQNAAVAKARREVIRAIVPGDLVEEAMEIAADTRRSEVKTDPAAARKRIADSFFSLGVMPAQLCQLLDKPSLEALTEAEVEYLRSIYAGMRDVEATWAEVMEMAGKKGAEGAEAVPARSAGPDALKSALGQRSGKKGKADVAHREAASGSSSVPAESSADPAPAPAPIDAIDGITDRCEACGGTGGKHGDACPYRD